MNRPTDLQQAIQRVEQQLETAQVRLGQGTLRYLDEAAWLVLWALQLPLDSDDQSLKSSISAQQWATVQQHLNRRIEQRLPMAYLSGEAWLQGVPFHVDSRAIIPRSLIAEVLADGLLDAFVPDKQAQVLDLCTGNGSLAILGALAWPHARIEALDISREALEVAKINVMRHRLQDQIQLRESDGLAQATGRYHLILCNPPYVNDQNMLSLPPEFQHEPKMALAGGADGMNFIRPLLAQVASFLHPKAALVLEMGNEIQGFDRAFPRIEGLWLPTSAGDRQVLLLTRENLIAAAGY